MIIKIKQVNYRNKHLQCQEKKKMVNCLKFLDQEPINMNPQLQKMENIFYQQLVNQRIQYLIQNHLKDFKIKQKVNYEKFKN